MANVFEQDFSLRKISLSRFPTLNSYILYQNVLKYSFRKSFENKALKLNLKYSDCFFFEEF